MRKKLRPFKRPLRTGILITALSLVFFYFSLEKERHETSASSSRTANPSRGIASDSAAPIRLQTGPSVDVQSLATLDSTNAIDVTPRFPDPLPPDKTSLIRLTRSNAFLALFSTALSLSDDEKQALKKALEEVTDQTKDQMRGLTEEALAKAIGSNRAKQLVFSLNRIHDIETVQLARKNLLFQLSQRSFEGLDPAVSADIRRLLLDGTFHNREELAEKIREQLEGRVSDEIANTIAEPLYLDEPAPVSEGGTELRPADARQFASHVRFLYEALDLELAQRKKLGDLARDQHEEFRLLLDDSNYRALSPAEQSTYLRQFSASQRQKFENGLKEFLTSEQLNRYFRLEGDSFDRAEGLIESED
jgi:hypothetical protein